MRFCPSCKAYMEDGEKQCRICGAILEETRSEDAFHGFVFGKMGTRSFPPPEEVSGGGKGAESPVPGGILGSMGGVRYREEPKDPPGGTETPSGSSSAEPEVITDLGLIGKMGDKTFISDLSAETEADGDSGEKKETLFDKAKSTILSGLMGKMGNVVYQGSGEDRGEAGSGSGTGGKTSGGGSSGPETIVYRRSPRLKETVPVFEVEIESPPNIGDKPEINWLSTLMPVCISVAVAVVMMVVMNSPMMMMFSIPMAISGLIVTLMNYRKQVKKFKKQTEDRQTIYAEHLEQALRDIESGQARQLQALNVADPDTMQCFRVVEQCERTLWDRTPADSDFGSVRIGSGAIPSAVTVKTPRASLALVDDELRDRAEQIREEHQFLGDAPIVCDLRGSRICGIVGPRADALDLIRNILVQFATHHSYTETRLICVFDEKDRNRLGWVADLPHALDEEREHAYVATSKEDARTILESLAAVLKERKLMLEADNSYSAAPLMLPYYLVVVAQPAYLTKDNPINEFMLRGPELGAGMLMAVEGIDQLPKECNQIITVEDGGGEIFNKNDAAHKSRYVMDELKSASLYHFSRRMRSIVCEEVGKKSPVPKKFSFYQMQDIRRAEDWNLGVHWAASDITRGICAPIGVMEGGELLSLDLHESAHGPHGLVAGTTGSGKSEVMLSYLMSLALRYHPYDLGFVIIDFKGGGMANRLAELPHLIGAITNMEGGAIDRSLASIKAELLKRQRLFAEAGVDSIDKYIRAVKSGRAKTPLPHLVIIVDEFAELKAQQPEFMAELISAARIGRSLGIHLILATQKPAGQVSDQIWSNSRFKICLKVASKEDSNDVLKSPLALSIKEPGRAYLQVGNNEVFELFQSGYSGGKAPGSSRSELEEIVSHIAAYCRAQRIQRLPPICLPELPECIDYPRPAPARGTQLPIGIVDDPERQEQRVQMLDVFTKNTIVLGSALSGKTNLLQLILRGAAENFSPEEVNIYLLDFASMALKNHENLAHVGGVVTMLEDEKLKNLFRLLNAEIESRRSSFLDLGVSSYGAYLEAGRRDKPRILLLIDNLAALRELYFQDEDALLPLCQSGLTYGISLVVTNVQTSGIGYKYLANFSNRIAMFCNDSGEYASFFEHCTLRIPDVHGRCIVEQDKKLLQCHSYLAFRGDREIDRAEAIRAWSDQITRRSAARAVPIPEIPERLRSAALIRAGAPGMRKRGGCVVGLDYETVSPVLLDLEHLGLMGLSGGDGSECRGLIRHLIRTAETVFPEEMCFYLMDGVGRGLSDCEGRASVAAYEYLPTRAPELVKKLEAELAGRYDALMRGEADLSREKLLVLVLSGNAAIEAVSGDSGALNAFKNLLGKYKALKVCVLLSECDNALINYASPEVLKKLKEEQKLIFCGELSGLKLFELSYAALKKFKTPLGKGDAYLIRGAECLRMKIPEDQVLEA